MFIRSRKRFGQHFLTDENVLEQLVAAVGISSHDYFIEIGPGRAALTQYLVTQAQQVDVIEIYRDLCDYLKKHFLTQNNINIFNEDALKFDWSSLLKKPPTKRIVGNLPYNITTPLLFKLFQWCAYVKDMHFLLQKEVVDRLTAPAGSSEYSRLTVMAQYYAHLSPLLYVDAEAFTPKPKVESAFLRILPYPEPPFKANNLEFFGKIVKEAFTHRRKTLANSLRKYLTYSQLEQINIDPSYRPQQLTVENFVKISNILTEQQIQEQF